jgi:hypothetical protein
LVSLFHSTRDGSVSDFTVFQTPKRFKFQICRIERLSLYQSWKDHQVEKQLAEWERMGSRCWSKSMGMTLTFSSESILRGWGWGSVLRLLSSMLEVLDLIPSMGKKIFENMLKKLSFRIHCSINTKIHLK